MVARTLQPNHTTAGPNRAMCWSSSYYALVAEPGTGRYGDRLAVCVAHGGRHAFYTDPRTGEGWCQDLGRPAPRPRTARRLMPTCREPSVVAHVDAETLGRAVADGVVDGFRRARAEQRAEQRRRWR